ncbi:MAG: ribonuclease P protein component [bacterium]|nr:ribonuclease P protein component [bacterium]
MLPKRYRLRKNIEFVATYAQKKYVSNSYFTINIGKTKPTEDFISKAAFVVSKKTDKRAVVRNKIKRRMREIYKTILRENPSFPKWMSVIISAKPEAKDIDFKSFDRELRNLIHKAEEKYD